MINSEGVCVRAQPRTISSASTKVAGGHPFFLRRGIYQIGTSRQIDAMRPLVGQQVLSCKLVRQSGRNLWMPVAFHLNNQGQRFVVPTRCQRFDFDIEFAQQGGLYFAVEHNSTCGTQVVFDPSMHDV